jgi:hypothetical protein
MKPSHLQFCWLPVADRNGADCLIGLVSSAGSLVYFLATEHLMNSNGPKVRWDIEFILLADGNGSIAHFHRGGSNGSGNKKLP